MGCGGPGPVAPRHTGNVSVRVEDEVRAARRGRNPRVSLMMRVLSRTADDGNDPRGIVQKYLLYVAAVDDESCPIFAWAGK